MPEYDVALELARLHIMKGADFIRQLKQLVSLSIFKPVENEKDIYAAEGCHRDDFPMLVDAARKAVAHGNIVFVNKGVYKMYDLKTIHGKSSVMNRLLESVGQTNHVLLNIAVTYNARLLAKDISSYFNINPDAFEVLVYKGTKSIQVKRKAAMDKDFVKKFMFLYNK